MESQSGWGEKVGKAKAESPKEVEGNVIFGEESLKTGGKGGGKVFHGVAPFAGGGAAHSTVSD